ncbi:MAG: ADP-ribosylation factor-like protein [Candidatus Helarchaeota archaeon]
MSVMKKILFCGIDNAGKTSILHILKKNYSFLNKLKPTKGIERTKSKILEIDFVLWDLGGQEQYITTYFERKDYIFSDLSLLFFVIDIQDELRFDNVLEYFEKIIQVFRENEQTPRIVIFFHKVDPDIKHTSNVRLYTKDLHKKITTIAHDFPEIAFFETSIFERWSILAAFSYGIRSLSEKNVTILSEYLEAWAAAYQANAILLLSKDDIILGEYAADDTSEKIITNYMDELRKIYSVSKKPVIVRLDGDLLTFSPIKVKNLDLYLIKYTNHPKITEEQFTKPLQIENEEDLEKILLNFFQKV